MGSDKGWHAEGEGRNAVFAAKSGWIVSAFDQSITGKEKASLLAQKNGVEIDYIVSDVENISYSESSFDAMALIYAHFHSSKRKAYHQMLSAYIQPAFSCSLNKPKRYQDFPPQKTSWHQTPLKDLLQTCPLVCHKSNL